MKLVIVESPSKAKKIRELLGKDYRVAASMGHVRDLPAKGGLAVAFKDGQVTPTYEPLEKSQRAVAELSALAKQSDEVLLASDPDREGEAIAWHVSKLLGEHAYKRVVFHAITKAEVQKAVASPRAVDMRLVNAQQARRVLDRVVGWVVSPTLRKLGKDAKSAGRVQSAALRVVAEREKEIDKFSTVDYLILAAKLEKPGSPPPFMARLVEWQGKPVGQRLKDPAIAAKIVAWAKNQPWRVLSCDRRDSARNAPPPFTTATVQQAASVRLKLNPDATMKLLQALFEDGKITYHRTDSTALAPEALEQARQVIAREFPPEYLPKAAVQHATKAANAQEAHEAIRPTHSETGPDAQGSGDAGKLYRLIWQRFIACQMAPGRDQITTLDAALAPDAADGPDGKKAPMGVFRAKGKVTLFDGWRRLTGEDATEEARPKKDAPKDEAGGAEEDDEAAELPLLAPGDALEAHDLSVLKRSTKPPPRYTQASLIKKLEHDGIGRPSTYAAILSRILTRGYAEEKKRKLHATTLGLSVTDFLVRHYSGDFIDLSYTARMEGELDRIARGEADWQSVVTQASFAVLKLAKAAGLWGNPLQPAPPTVPRALALAFCILAASGCAGAGRTQTAPAWVDRGSGAFTDGGRAVFHGVGTTRGIRNERLAASAADDSARAQVAKEVSNYVAVLTGGYAASTAAAEAAKPGEAPVVAGELRELAKACLRGTVIAARWRNSTDGSTYALGTLDLASVRKAIEEFPAFGVRARDYLKTNAEKAFDALAAEGSRR